MNITDIKINHKLKHYIELNFVKLIHIVNKNYLKFLSNCISTNTIYLSIHISIYVTMHTYESTFMVAYTPAKAMYGVIIIIKKFASVNNYSQFLCRLFTNWVLFLGLSSDTLAFKLRHWFSIGLKSGEYQGYKMMSNPCLTSSD